MPDNTIQNRQNMTQSITRLYDNRMHAEQAMQALRSAGLTDQQISIVAQRSSDDGTAIDPDAVSDAGRGAMTGAGVGGAVGAGAGLLAGVGLLAIPGIGPVVAAGWLAATALGAVAGAATGGAAGGLVGSLTGDGMSEADANVYAEGIRRGGSMVTARVPDDRENEVRRILDTYPSVEPIARGEEYRKGGWQRFDETAAPYVPGARRN